MMQEAEVHILLGIKIILFALGNQISCKKNCSVSSGRTEFFFTKKKNYSNYLVYSFCVCVVLTLTLLTLNVRMSIENRKR